MHKLYLPTIVMALALFLLPVVAGATNYTSNANGSWGTSTIWTPNGIPGASDNVTIAHNNTITVNGNYSCNNLTIGDATAAVTTVNVSSAYTLTIGGLCSINPNNASSTYTLNAATGTVKINGTFAMGTGGTNIVTASTGTVTFTPAVTISSSTQNIKLTGAGVINFNASFTDNYGKLTPFAGGTINFAGNYTVSTTTATWPTGTAVFSGTGTITANSSLSLYNVQTATSAATTLASASGTVVIAGAVTIGSGSTLTANQNFELDGNFTNSGTFTGNSNTVAFNGTTTITGATGFAYVQIGNTATSNTVSLTLNNSITCLGLTFNGYNKARTLTISNGDTLTVNGNLLINQPTAAKTNNLAINGGTCIVTGTFGFSGTVATASYISKATITTGLLVIGGVVSFDANATAANQAITITSTGNVAFGKSLGVAYGTLSITGSGSFNFNGKAPSLTFGGTGNPNFTTTNGCSINFADGFVNNTNALSFATTSNTNFTGIGTITGNADITFGNLQLAGADTISSTGSTITAGSCLITSTSVVRALQNFNVSGAITLGLGATYNQLGGTLTIAGDVIDSGTINASASGAIALNGNNVNIGGVGSINSPTGTISLNNNKTITAGSTLTFGTTGANTSLNITTGTTISNDGTVTVNGSITADDGSAKWLNNYESALSITGDLLDVGALDASTSPNTVTYNGSGDQTITAPLSSYYNLVVSTGGTKSMAAPVQVDNAVVISNAVLLDEGTNALTGSASLTMDNDSSELAMERSDYGTYPELSGAYNLTGGLITISQTDNTAVVTPAVYYNLNLNGTVAYDISGISTITRNFYMDNAATLNNNEAIKIGRFFTYTSSAYTTLYGDVTAYGFVLLAGTLDDGGNNIIVGGAGSWTMSGGSFNATGQTRFAPKVPVAQNIAGSSPTTFYDLVINNTANVTLSLSPASTTIVSGSLDLTAGNLNTDASNILLMQADATVLNGSAASYVNGPMQKAGAAAFVFPVGKSGIYGQAGVSGAVNAATLVTAEYFPASYSTLVPRAADLSQVSSHEYWMIERTVTQDPLQIQLFWTNATTSYLISCTDLTVAHYTAGIWINEPGVAVNGSVCSGAGSGSVQTTGYVTTFSPFTFGGNSNGHALPITLVAFNAVAVADKNNVLTTWQTALEINNAYFTLQRSADGENFSSIGTVKGAGNSAELLSYSFTDEAPLKGISYYRLQQTDNNGISTGSNIVAVNFDLPHSSLTVYPNPAVDQVSLNITNPVGAVVVRVYNIAGQLVFSKNYPAQESAVSQVISLPITQKLAAGIYTVIASVNQSDYAQKLVIQ